MKRWVNRKSVTVIKVFKDGNDLFYWCFHCNAWHTHGGGNHILDSRDLGTRASHCFEKESPLYSKEIRLQFYSKKEIERIKDGVC